MKKFGNKKLWTDEYCDYAKSHLTTKLMIALKKIIISLAYIENIYRTQICKNILVAYLKTISFDSKRLCNSCLNIARDGSDLIGIGNLFHRWDPENERLYLYLSILGRGIT